MSYIKLSFLIVIQIIYYIKANSLNLEPLRAMEQQGAQVSAILVNLNQNKILVQLHPELSLSPASISKLVIGAEALETWGPDKNFTTQIFARGTINNGVLYGDLIFYGNGDPYLSNEKLWFLCSDIARYGITKVTGKIIVNNSVFGHVISDANRQNGLLHSNNAYDAPLSSSAVNFSVVGIVITPNQDLKKRAKIALEPYSLPSIKIINKVQTNAKGLTKIEVQRNFINNINVFTVSGSISHTHSQLKIYRSIANPDQYAGEVINAFLQHNGVMTSGKIKLENSSLEGNEKIISEVQGYPLSWQLKNMFAFSNNFIADMLSLKLGIHPADRHNTHSLQQAAANLVSYMQEFDINKSYLQNPIIFYSGSGLTPENRFSSLQMVSLLSHMYRQTQIFPSFLAALSAPGELGTLKNRFFDTKFAHNSVEHAMLRAKTGTLSEPITVVSLAGYIREKNDFSAFSIIVNSKVKQLSIESIRNKIDNALSM